MFKIFYLLISNHQADNQVSFPQKHCLLGKKKKTIFEIGEKYLFQRFQNHHFWTNRVPPHLDAFRYLVIFQKIKSMITCIQYPKCA